jgi:GDPmannose 4,6-dehydratase
MLQQDTPDDYVIATQEHHSVREFVEAACEYLGIELRWEGAGVHERGIDVQTGHCIVAIDSRYFRPAEVELLIGDSTKARTQLGWKPRVGFKELVSIMAQADLEEAEAEAIYGKDPRQHRQTTHMRNQAKRNSARAQQVG